MTRSIYVAGPMRGLPEHNFPAFYAAADRFRRAGWVVRNPAEIGLEAFGNDPAAGGPAYMRADLRAICDVDAMALLPGWERSTGARCEVVVGITLGLTFYDAEVMEEVAPPDRVVIAGGYEKAPEVADSLDAVVADILAWQIETFTHRTPHSITNHLLREAAELHDDPSDNSEWADVVFLAVALIQDGTPNAPRDLIGALRAKLAVNKARTWGKPDSDGVVEHVESASSSPSGSPEK